MKRALDFLGALGAFALLWPLMAMIAVAVWLTLGNPIFFVQERPGMKGKPFRMFKFRTMALSRDDNGDLLPDEERLTGIGRFLRNTSLDELPELYNVLRGEMSLVGPRPLLTQYLARYSPEQARRHELRPGITGWAQVNGRNAIEWKQRLALDIWYVDHQSFWLDLRILGITLMKVILREGITADGHATMPEFMGDDRSGNLQKASLSKGSDR